MKTLTMKTFALIATLFTLCCLSGCDVVQTHKFRSYVTLYFELDNFVLQKTETGNLELLDYSLKSYTWRSKGAEKRIYHDLCERNGDVSYNKKLSFIGSPDQARAFSRQTITRIEVVSDADWDTAHPSGKLLNDITILLSMSPKKYIESGYKDEYDWTNKPEVYNLEELMQHPESITDSETKHPVYGLLSELREGDFKLMGRGDSELGSLVFEKKPTLATRHNLTVSLYLDDGTKKSAEIAVDF